MIDENGHLQPQSSNQQTYISHDRPAGFWMRFWAYITDIIIVFSINGIVLKIVNMVNADQITISVWTIGGIVSAIVFYIYFLLMTKFYGQTLGKMIFGLKVIPNERDDGPLEWDDLLYREVIGRFIYKSFFILNVLYIVVAFNKEKQGIHDMFGDTRVVHTN